MQRIYATNDFSELRYLQSLLEAKEIEYITKNEHLMGLGAAAGEVPPMYCPMEVWVLDPKQVPLAEKLAQRANAKPSLVFDSWQCNKCGERLEGQFTACWKCSTSRYSSVG